MKRGGFAILRVLRLISAFFSNFCSARPSAWTVSTRADALSTSADGKSTFALVIGRRAGSPSTCAFAVGTRAFASRPRAPGGGIVSADELISKLDALGKRETDDRLEMCLK